MPEGCEPGWVCGTTTSDDPIIYPNGTNENNEKDITDSEDDEDQDKDKHGLNKQIILLNLA